MQPKQAKEPPAKEQPAKQPTAKQPPKVPSKQHRGLAQQLVEQKDTDLPKALQGLPPNLVRQKDTDVPKALGVLMKDEKVAKILKQHLNALTATKLESGKTATGAKCDIDNNKITLSSKDENNKKIPEFHQFWAFLFESCNAINASEFKSIKDEFDHSPSGPALRKYGDSYSDTEAKTGQMFAELVEKLLGANPELSTTLDGVTKDFHELHKDIKTDQMKGNQAKGLSWKGSFRTSPHETGDGRAPQNLVTPDFYVCDKIGTLTVPQAKTLMKTVCKTKGVKIHQKEFNKDVNKTEQEVDDAVGKHWGGAKGSALTRKMQVANLVKIAGHLNGLIKENDKKISLEDLGLKGNFGKDVRLDLTIPGYLKNNFPDVKL